MNAALGLVSRWFDDAASGFARLVRLARRARRVELVERPDGLFDAALRRKGAPTALDRPLRLAQAPPAGPGAASPLLKRGQVHVLLNTSRFLFRPLELPRAAAPFIEGVVRAQIDRLTPWTAGEAVFGWSAPVDIGADKVRLIVAATARGEIAPISEALAAAGVYGITMSTSMEEDPAVAIPILSGETKRDLEAGRLRLGLIVGLGAAGLAFVGCLVAWIMIGGALDSRLQDLEGQIADRRARLLSPQGSAAEQALEALKKRKRATPSPVMVIEALSRTLPDDTHLTELRIENGKLQIAGLAGDASQLIHLIEQSTQFTHAAFVAPTVKGPSGDEAFRIEAQLQPSFEVTH